MTQSTNTLEQEVQAEITAHKVVIYAKGTKQEPRCGFTVETIQFFERYGFPYEVINVLENNEKRQYLSEMTNWPTLPKVFIGGKFYGDTDILDEMANRGEMEPLLNEVFGNQ